MFERQNKQVRYLNEKDLFLKNHNYYLENVSFKKNFLLTSSSNFTISQEESEPNMIKINDPVIIIGDIHGQFYDLLKILALFTQEKLQSQRKIDIEGKQQSLLFLGDYVDRGLYAVQVVSLLMILKISNPKNVIMLRGNHESRTMAQIYNFKTQCNQKYNQQIYDMLMDCFDSLPLVCLVNNRYFNVHGGISDKIVKVSQIDKIQRFKEIPLNGPFCDFVWSDPTSVPGGKLKKKSEANDSRDCSIYFGQQLATQFLNANKIKTIIRGHQVFQQGYKTYNWGESDVPSVITIFSAPNYCNTYGNKGAVMRIQHDKVKIRQYNQDIPENYQMAEKLDVFKWTLQALLPFVNKFSKCMMNRVSQLYIPELLDHKDDKKLQAFLLYYNQNVKNKLNKKGNLQKKQNQNQKKMPSIIELQNVQSSQFKSQKQYNNFLFVRSHQYYKSSQKCPKNRFSEGEIKKKQQKK